MATPWHLGVEVVAETHDPVGAAALYIIQHPPPRLAFPV